MAMGDGGGGDRPGFACHFTVDCVLLIEIKGELSPITMLAA